MKSRGHLFGTADCDCSELWVCYLHGGPHMLLDLETRAMLHDPLGWDKHEIQLPPSEEEVWEHYMDEWKARITDHYDNAIVIDGVVGSGKSSFALRIGLGLTDGALDLERDVLYALDALLERLENSKPGDVVVVDEAILVAQAKAGGSNEVYILERALALSRELGVTLVLNIPFIRSLAKGIRERRVEFWLHVEERGIATVHELTTAINYRATEDMLPFRKVGAPFTHLMWSPFPAGDPLWIAYSRLKHERTLAEIKRAKDEVRVSRKNKTSPEEKERTRKRKWARKHRAERSGKIAEKRLHEEEDDDDK